MNFDARPLVPQRWSDLEALFTAKGCSEARGCWCMYYRRTGPDAKPPEGTTRARIRRAELRALVESGVKPGLIGYRGDAPVGWVSVGPRTDYLRLARSRYMKAPDELPVWSVVCFVVPAEFRGQGVAGQLLAGAIDYARAGGADLLEAYPVDRPERSRHDPIWFGPKKLYDRAGFAEVARRAPHRLLMRRPL